MTSIAIYVEGGGDTTNGKAQLRVGFNALLRSQKELARVRRFSWKLVACGSRNAAAEMFVGALARASASDLVLLLVDAEQPDEDPPIANHAERVVRQAGWPISGQTLGRIFLMTPCMEAWLLADPDVLEAYYGKGFRSGALPRRQPLDTLAKDSLFAALAAATRQTQKGQYGKIKHASELLQRIRPEEVSDRCSSFKTFADGLSAAIEAL